MKNKAAQQLGRLGGKATSEAKTAAARKNAKKGGRPPGLGVGTRPIVMLHRADGTWWLARWKHGIIGAKDFPTARAARDYAASVNWGVKRLPECDS